MALTKEQLDARFKREGRKFVQIQTAQISMGAIALPTVFALTDDGEVYTTSPQMKAGQPPGASIAFREWEKLPALPGRKE